jgi:hypothetical protein
MTMLRIGPSSSWAEKTLVNIRRCRGVWAIQLQMYMLMVLNREIDK